MQNSKVQDCMKTMYVEVHPDLCEMSDSIKHEIEASGAHVDIVSEIWDPSLVLFCRKEQPVLAGRRGELHLTPQKVPCARALCVKSADDIAALVSSRTLATQVKELSNITGKALTLVIQGVKEHCRGKTNGRRTLNSNKYQMSEIELEMAITDLLVSANCDTVIVNSELELSSFIIQFTKAIAEEPFKRAKRICDEQAEFYMRGDKKQCVAVDKNGNGLSSLWQQMIEVLPSSSLETARAICAKYKTPRELYEALQKPSMVNNLADIGVARTAVPGAKFRRLGPDFVRRLQILFTSDDGDVVVE